MSALWLCIACALLLSGCDARRHRRRKAQVANVARHDVQRSSERIIPFLQQGDALDVCECEDASLSAHGGLQCEREGWFIYSFEAVGRWVRVAVLPVLCMPSRWSRAAHCVLRLLADSPRSKPAEPRVSDCRSMVEAAFR